MAATEYNILRPGPNGDFPWWPRDENGVPVKPPFSYGRGSSGELYALYQNAATPLEPGVPALYIPTVLPVPVPPA